MSFEELAEERGKLYRSWVRDASKVRGPMKIVARRTETALVNARISKDGTELLSSSVRRVTRQVEKDLADAIEYADQNIQGQVEKAVSRAAKAQNKHLKSIGARELSRKQLTDLQRAVVKSMDQEFPKGSGLTYHDRIARIRRHHEAQLKGVIRRSYSQGDVVHSMQRDLRAGLAHTAPGRTPLAGGSAAKKLQRMLVAEETRLANEVERRVVRASGAGFAYWRLNPRHKWYGGAEICEVLASSTGSDVLSELRRLKVDTSQVALEGLYTVDNYPEYPHPFCICFLEAWARQLVS